MLIYLNATRLTTLYSLGTSTYQAGKTPGKPRKEVANKTPKLRNHIECFIYNFSSLHGKRCENRNIPINYFHFSKSIFSKAKTATANALLSLISTLTVFKAV